MTERIQKIISGAGFASRRKAEEMILSGRVQVNGVTAQLGQSADPEKDVVTVDGMPMRQPKKRRYIMLNKPKGYVTTVSDDRDRPTVMELVSDAGTGLYPVGRLDMYSEGLLILTDDGDAANMLTHPSHKVKKVYNVWVQGENITAAVKLLRALREVDGQEIRPAEVSLIDGGGKSAIIEVKISEGRNRQVRKMCGEAGLKVHRLVRVSEGKLTLGDLPSGKWRPLGEDEIAYILSLGREKQRR